MIHYIIFFIFLLSSAWGMDPFTHFPPLQDPYHPVSTQNQKAQEAFDQGLLGIYAFNYEGAYEKFKEASTHDPQLAMAYWGMTMALDEKFSPYPTAEQAKTIYDLGQKALELSVHATSSEKALINALLKRLTLDPKVKKTKLREEYAKEMQKLVTIYPDDPDANTLYVESLMDLLDWDLWTIEKKPKGNAIEICNLLLSILERDPYHVGANHYYIHAIEHSSHPEYGLMPAERLDKLAPLFSQWSHLLHTPSHIYMRIGYYHEAVEDGERALVADKAYLKKHGPQSEYAIHGLTHNLSFLIMAYLWSDCYEEALKAAELMVTSVKPHIKDMPGFQYFMIYCPEVYLYFNRYDELLSLPEPEEKFKVLHTYWHYTRSVAYSGLKKIEEAEKEKKEFLKEKEALKKIKKLYDENTFTLAEDILNAFLAHAKGENEEALRFFKKAVEKQEQIDILEWYEPISQRLGNLQIEMQRGEEAEKTYRAALKFFPMNGRILQGLYKSLKMQGKEYYWPQREAEDALKRSKAKDLAAISPCPSCWWTA